MESTAELVPVTGAGVKVPAMVPAMTRAARLVPTMPEDPPSMDSATSEEGGRLENAASDVPQVPGNTFRQGAAMRHPFPITPSANITPVLVVVARNMQPRQESA